MAVTIDGETVRALAEQVIAQLEGPYKLYIIIAAGIILTALVTRFIFKTFKWFLLLGLLVAVFLGGFYLFAEWSGL